MTRTNNFRTLVALALLCVFVALGARPAHSEMTFAVNADGGDQDGTDNEVRNRAPLVRESEHFGRFAVIVAAREQGTVKR